MNSLKSLAPTLMLALIPALKGCNDTRATSETQPEPVSAQEREKAAARLYEMMGSGCASDTAPTRRVFFGTSIEIRVSGDNAGGFNVISAADPQKKYFSCSSEPVNPIRTVDITCTSETGKQVFNKISWDKATIGSLDGSRTTPALMITATNYGIGGPSEMAGYRLQAGDTCRIRLTP